MKYLAAFLLMFFFYSSNAQTWSKKLHWIPQDVYMHHDSATGIKDAAVMLNGNICALAQVDQKEVGGLYIINPTTQTIVWKYLIGAWGGLSSEFTTAICATSDTCILLCDNWYSQSSGVQVSGFIHKFSATGNVLWSDTFQCATNQSRTAVDIAEDSAGNYLALVQDTIYRLNRTTGVIIQNLPVLQNALGVYPVPGSSDFIINSYVASARFTNSGTLLWTFNHPITQPSNLAEITSNAFYVLKQDTLYVIDLQTGNLTNTTILPTGMYSSMNRASSGNLFISIGQQVQHFNNFAQPQTGGIIKINSTGNIIGVKTIPFPLFGLSWVSELPGGNLFCSGTYRQNTVDPILSQNYMPFCFTTDPNGNGVMDSTTYMWPGDANNNFTLQFSDDALYILQSFGVTGQMRDTINYYTLFNGLDHSDFLADWSTTNTAGVNNKFCDVNGDGIVDTSDLNAFTPYFSFPVTVSYRTSTLPDLSFVPATSVVAAGDSVRFYIIAGSSIAIDSISGLAFSNNPTQSAPFGSIQFLSSTLGVPGTSIRTFSSVSSATGIVNAALTRIDKGNSHLSNDTIGIISFYIPTSFTDTFFTTSITTIKAILGNGVDVPIEAINGSVTVTASNLISEVNTHEIVAYPNPTKNKITISNRFLGEKAEIYNSTAEIVMKMVIPNNGTIDVTSLNDGIYFMKIFTKNKNSLTRFIIAR